MFHTSVSFLEHSNFIHHKQKSVYTFDFTRWFCQFCLVNWYHFKHLVGDEQHSFGVELLSCDVLFDERLKSILANVSNLALTNGDFSVCSLSEFSCSELTDRPLRTKINLHRLYFKRLQNQSCKCVCERKMRSSF